MSPLQTLIDAGLTLRSDGERLIVTPASALTEPLRGLIRDRKPELLVSIRRAEALTADLLAAINRCCDVRGDNDRNRSDLIAEAATLPPHLMADAREHFVAEAERFSHACALPGHQPATERTPE